MIETTVKRMLTVRRIHKLNGPTSSVVVFRSYLRVGGRWKHVHTYWHQKNIGVFAST